MKMDLKRSLAVVLGFLIAVLGISTIYANTDNSNKDKVEQRQRVVTKKLPSKMRMYAGEISLIIGVDMYYTLDEVKNLDTRTILRDSEMDAAYSLTGMEKDYYTEVATVPAELDVLVNERITFDAADLAKLKGFTEPGHMFLKGTYYNQKIADKGMPASADFDIPISIVEEGVTEYEVDMDNTSGMAIHVSNFEVKNTDAASFNDAKARSNVEANFKAWDTTISAMDDFGCGSIEPGRDLRNIVKVDAGDINKIKATKKSGAFDLRYRAEYYCSTKIEKTAKTFVSNENSNLDRGQNVALFANNSVFNLAKANTATYADVIKASDIAAYDYKYGTKFADSKLSVDVSALNNMSGKGQVTLPVTFKDGAKEVTTTVKIDVIDQGNIVVGDKYSLAYDDIYLSETDAAKISHSEILDKAHAISWLNDDFNVKGNVKVDNHDIKPIASPPKYKANISVIEEPATNAAVKVTVTKGTVIVGQDYYMVINDFKIGKDDAKKMNDAMAIDKSKAKAFKKTDDSPAKVKVISNAVKPTAGIYDIVIAVELELDTKGTSKATVKDSDVVVVGEKYTIEANHFDIGYLDAKSITDDQIKTRSNAKAYLNTDENVKGTISVLPHGITEVEKTYQVKMSVVQEPTTVAAVDVTVTGHGTIIEGKEYYLKFTPITMGLKDASNISNKMILDKSRAEATKKTDPNVKGTVQVVLHDVKALAGNYKAILKVQEDSTATGEVPIEVKDKDIVIVGDKYTLEMNNFIIGQNDAAIISNDMIIEKAKAKAYLNKNHAVPGNVDVVSHNIVNVVKKDYVATLNVVEEPATKGDINVEVQKGTVVIGDKYTIRMDDMVIGLDDADTITDQFIITKSNAKAYLTDDPATPGKVKVDKHNVGKVEGKYSATLSVVEETATKGDIKITVLPSRELVEGDNYFIGANPFTINSETAKTITEAQIITRADAKGYLKPDLTVGGKIKITANTIKEAEGTYPVEFYVAEDTTAKITIMVTVNNGGAPILNVTSPIVIAPGGAFDPEAGITVSDVEDDKNNIPLVVTHTGAYDVNVEGMYTITYSVKDSDYNVTTDTRVLIVNDGNIEVGNDYAIYARNFDINDKDVKQSNPERDKQIVKEAKAYAKDIKTGEDEDVIVKDADGYKDVEALYNIKLGVAKENTLIKSIKVNVTNHGYIVIGDKYKIGATNFSITDKEVGLSNEDIIKKAKAEAWLIEEYATKGKVLVHKADLLPIDGVYDVILKVQEEPATMITIKVTVIDKTPPEILGLEHKIFFMDDVANLPVNEDQFKDIMGIKIKDNDAVRFDSNYDQNMYDKMGYYIVTYEAEDASHNISTKNVKVIVIRDGQGDFGIYSALVSENFTVRINDAPRLTNNSVLALSNTVAFDMEDGSNLIGRVKVNQDDLKKIQNPGRSPQSFKLRFTLEYKGDSLSREITVRTTRT